MARLWQSGFELNSTTDEMEHTLNSAPVSVGTTNVRSGTYAGRVNAGAGFFRQHIFTSNQTTVGYIGVAIYIVAAPNANTQLVRWSTTGNVSVGNITLKTTRALSLLKSDGSQIGSDSSVLSLNTWYYIELKNDASTSPGALEGRIDGVSFASGANSNQGSWARALVGNVTGAQTTNDIWFDDWKINDSSGSSQTGYPGLGKIIHLKPNAAGDVNGFATQVGGTAGSSNNFTRVNEIPPDDATSYNATATLNVEDLFNCDASGIGAADTVNVVAVGARLANLTSADATASLRLEILKTSGGTKAQSGNIIPNSTSWLTNAAAVPRNYPLVRYTDPDSAAWTQSTLDTMEIGYILNVANTQAIAVSGVWAGVDYTPSTGTAYSQILTQVLSLTDTVIKSTSRTLTDPLVLTDTLLKNPQRTLSDQLVLTDTVIKSTARTIVEALILSDTLIRTIARTIDQALVITDTLTSLRAIFKELLETIILNDTLLKYLNRNLTDVLVLSDTLVKETRRTLSDAIVLSDSIIRYIARTILDTLILNDTVLKALTRTLDEAIILSDTITRQINKLATESLVLSDTIVRNISRNIVDAILLGDTLLKSISRTLTDNVVLNDVLTALGAAAKSIGNFIIYSFYGATKAINDNIKTLILYDTKKNQTINDKDKDMDLHDKGRDDTLTTN